LNAVARAVFGILHQDSTAVPARQPRLTDPNEGNNVNRYALAAALALTLGGAARATAIDLSAPVEMAQVPAPPHDAAVAAAGRIQLVAPRTSDLPEPAVFAMMLLGLVLIGYRASRDSSEKFR
jgi:hypothetical protein